MNFQVNLFMPLKNQFYSKYYYYIVKLGKLLNTFSEYLMEINFTPNP